MKVNLGVRHNTLNGYLNLDPTAQPTDQDRLLCNLQDLSPLVDTNECEDFLCNDTLDFLPLPARHQILTHWLSLVAHGGIFVLTGNDLYEVSRLIYNGPLGDINQANEVIYRMDVSRKSMVTPEVNLQSIMSTGQFTLEKVSYQGYQYCIVVRRK